MLLKIAIKDFQRNKIVTIGLFLFIMLSALLVASASHIIMELSGSLNHLLLKSNAPHFVQMHQGPINHTVIQRFVSANPIVKKQQTVEMLRIDGSNITLGNQSKTELNSVMDIGFVRQNPSFDFLLNLENEVIQLSEGEIAVPIYYRQQNHLSIGDPVTITAGTRQSTFTIVDFVRDVQMNPALVSSKRFVVSDRDYTVLKRFFKDSEYLIEFQLTDRSKLSEFRSAYEASALPAKGPTVDYALFKTLNALTDGVIALVIILASILLMIIALLCLRFTMIAALEEDYRELGVMKAIGIPQSEIRAIYMAKYIVMAASSSLLGYLASLAVIRIFTANISLYLGTASPSLLQYLVPVLAVAIVFGAVVLFCKLMLRRLNGITAVEALRSGTAGAAKLNTAMIPLSRRKWMNVNIFLGIKDVVGRFKMYGLLLFILMICTFIIIVPVNLLHTLQSPKFITYMGIGQSHIRIDLQQSGSTERKFESMLRTLEKDQDIAKFSPLVTSRFKVLGSDGVWESLNVESGDFSIFPLSYIEGTAPEKSNEIALSDLNARDLDKGLGEELLLAAGGTQLKMTVSGIYQDITNGGRTAKARLPYDPKTAMWYVVAIDVKPDVEVSAKVDQYAKLFYPAKITHLDSYLSQTLGSMIAQLRLATLLIIAISLAISVLITSLFLKMLLAKDASQISILRSIGFSLGDIRRQYMVRMLLIAGLGITLGTIAAGTLGQGVVRVIGSMMGASKIQFVIQPMTVYGWLPLVFVLVVGVTTFVSTMSIKKSGIAVQMSE
ncbi:ABC transporter permease [Paenibacillus agri]|uniref:ABC transporter permease n=1 Tax=Paenibacillus agri TaxID=2744309 RepID=A0A850ER59_9BACL|nr:ABC transporter permease [Paenibacillus agri]NUU62017.1 ABC transporter permease [Paenibacillus agri]